MSRSPSSLDDQSLVVEADDVEGLVAPREAHRETAARAQRPSAFAFLRLIRSARPASDQLSAGLEFVTDPTARRRQGMRCEAEHLLARGVLLVGVDPRLLEELRVELDHRIRIRRLVAGRRAS